MQLHHAVSAAHRPDRNTLKLADHLECMLAACAELAQCLPHDNSAEGAGHALRAELSAITHLLQARACARETALGDPRLAECIGLFIAGTQALEYASAIAAHEPLLGRRLAVSTAVQFASLMLGAIDSVYPAAPAAAPVDDAMHAEAA